MAGWLERWRRAGGGGNWVSSFWVGMCRPGHPVLKKISLIPRSRSGPVFLFPVLEFALKLIPRSRNGPIFYTLF